MKPDSSKRVVFVTTSITLAGVRRLRDCALDPEATAERKRADAQPPNSSNINMPRRRRAKKTFRPTVRNVPTRRPRNDTCRWVGTPLRLESGNSAGGDTSSDLHRTKSHLEVAEGPRRTRHAIITFVLLEERVVRADCAGNRIFALFFAQSLARVRTRPQERQAGTDGAKVSASTCFQPVG